MRTVLEAKPQLMKAIVGHKQGVDVPVKDYEKIAELFTSGDFAHLNQNTKTNINKWLERSLNIQHNLKHMANGRTYGNRVVNAIVQTNSQIKKDILTTLNIPVSEANNYKVFKEVQFWTNKSSNEYMIADAVLVKYKNVNFIFR